MTDANQAVQLLKIDIQGYRSCKSTHFSPHPELSALIGINGVGKTNLLNAIRLLSSRSIRVGPLDSESELAGSETRVTAWFIVGKHKIGLRLKILLSSSSRNPDEVAGITEEWNFHSITRSRAWKEIPAFIYMRGSNHNRYLYQRELFEYRERMRRIGVVPDNAVLGAGKIDFGLLENKDIARVLDQIQLFRTGIAYYSASQFTDPTRCPSGFEVDENSRLSDSFGTSKAHLKFIYDLYRLKSTNPSQYVEYINFVSHEQLGLIRKIIWRDVRLSSTTADVKSGLKVRRIRKTKTLVIPKIQIGSSYITFNQLSEGTFKTLALVFYIMTDASQCLLLEEPEVCIHHGLLNKIIATIKAYSKSKQVIFSTHSDLVLDDLEPANIFVVELLKGNTIATRLESWVSVDGRKALHAYLNESGTLGDYWKSGGLS